MKTVYGAKYCSLHVRVSNRAALGMYADVLKYEIIDIENEYYADKEDAYDMVLFYDPSVRDTVIAEKKAAHQKRRNEKGIKPSGLENTNVDVSSHGTFAGKAEAKEESKEESTAASQSDPPMSKS